MVKFVDTLIALLIAIAKLIHPPTFEETRNWAWDKDEQGLGTTSPIKFLIQMISNKNFPDNEFKCKISDQIRGDIEEITPR